MKAIQGVYLRFFSLQALLVLVAAMSANGQPVSPPAPYAATVGNYIMSWQASAPIQDSNDILTRPITDVHQVNQYYDGLGRLIQTVSKQASPQQKDMVTPVVYDAFGREVYNYLPFSSFPASGGGVTNDGSFKLDAFQQATSFGSQQYPGENYVYSQTQYEASPLNRVQAVDPPGNSWVGSGRGVSKQYVINGANDSVQLWNISFTPGSLPSNGGQYAAGLLYKNVAIDEQGHQTVEYKDKDGLVVMKKVQVAASPGNAHVGWLCTYYVYDDLNNLRFVIPPRATEIINVPGTWTISVIVANELCFRYEYDYRNRMIVKKVPGAGEVHMVYDTKDRLVMTQDSLLRAQKKWEYTTYDTLDRPSSTGLLLDPGNYNNASYHQGLASSSADYPNLALYTTELLTTMFYDNYSVISAAAGLPASMATNLTGNGFYFNTNYNTSPSYAVPIVSYPISRGQITGTMAKVLGTASQYLYSETFYDDRARAIQTFSVNYTGGMDTLTTQYDFSGKPLRTLESRVKPTNTAQNHRVLTKTGYDAGFRVTSIWKNIDSAASDQLIDSMHYDELSQLQDKSLGNSLDDLAYNYNIRGWLTDINKNFLQGSTGNYFGMELAYDKASSITGTTYLSPVYNGNIAGMIWKSAGDGVDRKYDFGYDVASRLTGAAYLDTYNGNWGRNAMDYTVDNLSYDANGNIMTMNQHGFKLGAPTGDIDMLSYTYESNGSSNKLTQVQDAANDTASTLGDFHYKGAKQDSDYRYDGNGNLTIDNNKGIDSIYYNYLNLPQQVHMKGKGNIFYTYDATGNKLLKQTVDSTAGLATTTLYLGGFQYQRRSPIARLSAGVDTLQFVGHEEGRARWAFHKYLSGDSAYGWEYDFAERDHLGNTRVLLTQEKDTAQYMATMEAKYRATENALFYGIDSTCVPRPAGYPDDTTYTSPNDSVIRVNGNGPEVGPAIILKVMSGDKIDLGVQYYYAAGTASPSSPLSAQNLLYSLASGLATLSPAGGESFSVLSNSSSSPLLPLLNNSIANQDSSGTGKPQAYLNWMLLDNQFNYVAGNSQSGAIQVGAAGTQSNGALQSPLAMKGISIEKSGYLYIYVSNSTKGWDVFFDNLSVTHYSGPLIEENHYYPFGLTMAGISDKAIKSNYAENKYRYNKGSELQNKEFSDGSGLEMYETHFRELDPQLGRWWQIDPVFTNGVDGNDEVNGEITEGLKSQSPYASMDNNPVLRSDPNGDCPICVIVILIGLLTTSEPAVAPSSNHAHDLQDNQAINKAHTDATLHAAGSLLTGGAKMIVAVGKAIYDSRQGASTQQEASTPQKPRNAPAQEGVPNSSKIESKDASGKTTKYSTYDNDGKLVKQVEADRGANRHGVEGATKKTPTENRLPDGTTKPGKMKIEPASPEETPPGNNKKT